MLRKTINIISLKQVIDKRLKVEYESKITSPFDAYDIFRQFDDGDREYCLLLCLNTKNVITGLHIISIGGLNSAIVHPREVYKLAILNNSASIIICHNHPSGNSRPSAEDIKITERIAEAGEILGIELLDHIISSPSGSPYYSFKENLLI